ncbi:MAG: PAS domain-containing protein [Acidobacteria bacterium]|nr:PAS domain-containing protein [Acidobacteriota bacterium]
MSSPTNEQIPLTRSVLLGRILRPPVDELPFWIIQISLLVIVSVHYLADVRPGFIGNSFPTGVPVAVLVIPIGYSALRYGLVGSTATMAWAIVLWLPDLLLPHDQGHVTDDLLNLSIVLLVAIIFGRRIERERVNQSRALAVQAGYRRLFESNRSPILVLDNDDIISDANPAAFELFGPTIIGRSGHVIFGDVDFNQPQGHVLTLANGHDYRLDSVAIALGASDQRRQLNLEDVTEERSEERRSRQFARQIVEVEEAQRRQLARELHDEPLQLFLHLARRIETLSAVPGVPREVVSALEEARGQSLDAASRLRTLARDLRPPALDQLGLVAALSSLVAHLDADGELSAQLEVRGVARRLMPDVELGAFRIVQESCNNALRHANATHLNVIVAFSDDLLELTIVDDGKGFDLGESSPPGSLPSLGIIGMRERARLLGGTLSVHSTPGVGTVVQAALGLEASTSAQTL